MQIWKKNFSKFVYFVSHFDKFVCVVAFKPLSLFIFVKLHKKKYQTYFSVITKIYLISVAYAGIT